MIPRWQQIFRNCSTIGCSANDIIGAWKFLRSNNASQYILNASKVNPLVTMTGNLLSLCIGQMSKYFSNRRFFQSCNGGAAANCWSAFRQKKKEWMWNIDVESSKNPKALAWGKSVSYDLWCVPSQKKCCSPFVWDIVLLAGILYELATLDAQQDVRWYRGKLGKACKPTVILWASGRMSGWRVI